jgi:hypothetical protein
VIGRPTWELLGGPWRSQPSQRTMDAVAPSSGAAEDRLAGRPYSPIPTIVLDHQAARGPSRASTSPCASLADGTYGATTRAVTSSSYAGSRGQLGFREVLHRQP